MTFSTRILNWYERNRRQLPWRNTKNPYKIWLSEIILQQTRIAQGLPYYLEFIRKYPTVFDLAKAEEQEILKTWQGLGYYSRARNLHETAKHLAYECEGKFPETYSDLIKLKGVGDYTASAIASICFDEAQPVIDGNVYRVLSRCFDVEIPIDSSQGKKHFKALAREVMSETAFGNYNQGIMEIGATVCVPKSPRCECCPIADLCLARARNTIRERPVKKKKLAIRERYFDYLVFLDPKRNTLLQQRTGKDIWRNLYEFPLIETDRVEDITWVEKEIRSNVRWPSSNKINYLQDLDKLHKLSHQTLHARFWMVHTEAELPEGVPVERLEEFPVPVLIQDAFQALKNSYF